MESLSIFPCKATQRPQGWPQPPRRPPPKSDTAASGIPLIKCLHLTPDHWSNSHEGWTSELRGAAMGVGHRLASPQHDAGHEVVLARGSGDGCHIWPSPGCTRAAEPASESSKTGMWHQPSCINKVSSTAPAFSGAACECCSLF